MQSFFQDEEKDQGPLTSAIAAACEGLVYISETDSPVMPFSGSRADAVTAAIILQQTGTPSGEPVEERSADDLFTRLTADKEWYGEIEKARAKKFLELWQLLEENVSSLKVFRIGSIRIRIYVVGLDKDGCLQGVTTLAVET